MKEATVFNLLDRTPLLHHPLTSPLLVAPQLAAEQDGARHSTSSALRALLRGCVDADMVGAAMAHPAGVSEGAGGASV